MKRDPSLQPLSREHHFALAQVRAIRWALAGREGTPREARASFLSTWKRLIAEHFAAEERWILPLVPLREDAERLRKEHDELRSLVERLSIGGDEAEPDLDLLNRLARALEEHIRWEERHLFPAIETGVPAEELRSAGNRITEAGKSRPGS